MAAKHEPNLVVRLVTDDQGRPKYIEDDDQRHYKVVFEVENAPEDAYVATFELDPSYYDPIRTLKPDSDGKFRLATTTHGDYPLIVRLLRSNGVELVLKDSIVRGLRRTRSTMASSPAIDAALSEIADH
ncbi:MAG TPA: hypothetical protein VEI03_17305 [Stellaceae bacterium]|nr:hypothetical protein [Stellaceae bacterium]